MGKKPGEKIVEAMLKAGLKLYERSYIRRPFYYVI